MDINNIRIAVIGLGYVGLPLMVEFAKKYPTLGFDINIERISQLRDGIDSMKDLSKKDLKEAVHGSFSVDPADLKDYNVYIITVPTPVDKNNRPDLTALKNTCQLVGKVLSKNDIVIYESTVFPGATEEVCIPILEEFSGFKLNESFYVGYSPERINPGDKKHRLSSVIKSLQAPIKKPPVLLTPFTNLSSPQEPILPVVLKWQRLQKSLKTHSGI